MNFGFLAGLGFLALIGIPILIIIYILKPKFQERKISSTYIWKLSLKYRKRKIPLQWLKSLLLVVQCVIVAVLAMLIAKPYIATGVDSRDYRKIVIIDASASMMAESDGTSRFDRAIEKACEIAETATEENTMTVILCSDVSTVILKDESDVGNIQRVLRSQKASGTAANYSTAVAKALEIAGETPTGFTLITDHDFKNSGYIEVINVSDKEWNLAVDDAWEDIEDNKQSADYLETIFYANYFSYNTQLTIVPCAKIKYTTTEGGEVKEAVIRKTAVTLQQQQEDGVLVDGVYFAQVKFDYQDIKGAIGMRFNSYKSVEFYAEDTSGNVITDSFSDDDSYYVISDDSNEKFSVLLVGDDYENSLFYLERMLQSVSSCYTERVIPSELTQADMDKKNSGYDLYIYDGYVPKVFPNDGAVWIINPPTGDYSAYGFTIDAVVTPTSPEAAKVYSRGAAHEIMSNIKNSTTVYQNLTGVFAYSKYSKATLTDGDITKLVTTSDNSSALIFTGVTQSRVKFTVFSFDLVQTDFPLMFQNFPLMVQNIISYSTGYTIVNGAGRPAYGDYAIGEEITISVQPNTTKLTISVGSGENEKKVEYQATDLNADIVYTLDRGGFYTITQTVQNVDGTVASVVDNLYVRCNTDESNLALMGDTLVGDEQPVGISVTTTTRKDLIYKYFAAALVVLLLIEWGLQYREQY